MNNTNRKERYMNIEDLRKLCSNGSVLWSVHAMERIQERGIFKPDIHQVIMNGTIIEDYPDSFPYPACLILGSNQNSQNIHVVCGCNGTHIKIITAYYPDSERFDESGIHRKEK